MRAVKRRSLVVCGVALTVAGASIGCGGSLSRNPLSAGTGGATSSSGRGGRTGSAGTSGIAGASGTGGLGGDAGAAGGRGGNEDAPMGGFGGEIDCPSTATKGAACASADVQRCNRTCGPEQVGAKTEACSTNGVYVESGCIFDPNRDYSCYSIPSVANPFCPAGTLQAATDCGAPTCSLCNSSHGLPGGQYVDSTGASKTGYCVCQAPDWLGLRTWSCATDTQWPCPGRWGCSENGIGGTSGTGGVVGSGGSSGTGGRSGAGGAAGAGGASFGAPACPATVTKGGACATTDVQLCYKTCGPERTGVKADTCIGGVYAEMSGCTFDSTRDYSCYKIPSTSTAACGADTPIAGTSCDVAACQLCNSTEGLPGGTYFDSAGAPKLGYCVCQPPNSAGTRAWSCASDTAWPCPAGAGC